LNDALRGVTDHIQLITFNAESTKGAEKKARSFSASQAGSAFNISMPARPGGAERAGEAGVA